MDLATKNKGRCNRMRIQPGTSNQLVEPSRTASQRQTDQSGNHTGAGVSGLPPNLDSVALSGRAETVKNLTDRVSKNLDPLRAQRVSELREQIQNGTYRPDSSVIAASVLADETAGLRPASES